MDFHRVWLLTLTVAVPSIVLAANDDSKLTLEQVSQVEGLVDMPKSARKIEAYARYYTTSNENGTWILRGLFVLEPGHIGVHIVERSNMPRVFDGGCLVVELKFDMKAGRQIEANCNGVA